MSADPKRLPWYSEGVRFECQRTGCCCTNHGGYSEVYLTDEDEARMLAHFQLPRHEFRRRFTRIRNGWRTLQSRDGSCIFLEGRACGVYQARPRQCETWPFWKRTLDEKVWMTEVVPFCAGVGKGKLWTREEIEAVAERASENEES